MMLLVCKKRDTVLHSSSCIALLNLVGFATCKGKALKSFLSSAALQAVFLHVMPYSGPQGWFSFGKALDCGSVSLPPLSRSFGSRE